MSGSAHLLESGIGVICEGEAPRKKKDRKHKPDEYHGGIQGHQDEKHDVTAVVEVLKKIKKKRKPGKEVGNEADGMIHSVTRKEVAKENNESSGKISPGFVHEEEGSQEKKKNKRNKPDKNQGGIQEGHKEEKQDGTVLIEKDLQKKKKKRKHNDNDADASAVSDSANLKEETKKKVLLSTDGYGFISEKESSQEKKEEEKHKHDEDCVGVQDGYQDENRCDIGNEENVGRKKKKKKHMTVPICVNGKEEIRKKGPSSTEGSGFIHEEEGSEDKKKRKKHKNGKNSDENQFNVQKEKDFREKKKNRKHKHETDSGELVKDKGGPPSDNVLKNVTGSRKDKTKRKQKQDVAAELEQPGKGNGGNGPEFVDSDKDGVNSLENGNREKKKKKRKAVRNGESQGNGNPKKVSFSRHVEVFPSSDSTSDAEECAEVKLVQGKRFTEEEDELIMNAVHNYIEAHGLGEEGVDKVLNCKKHPEVKNCWKEIGTALPWRPYTSVYTRAHVLLERSDKRMWTPEEYEFVCEHVAKHGPQWKALADELGKHRFHVKDTWRRIKLMNKKKGRWSQDEYQKLFDLVNVDLRLKASQEKILKHGMLRDNICWGAISDKLSTRAVAPCCMKWYNQLSSPMAAQGIWTDSDDYRLLDALTKLDACCIEDVDWDNLLEHRSGDVCQTRWDQMVRYIGHYAEKSFSEQVDILADRYRPDLLEAKVAYENKPAVDMPMP